MKGKAITAWSDRELTMTHFVLNSQRLRAHRCYHQACESGHMESIAQMLSVVVASKALMSSIEQELGKRAELGARLPLGAANQIAQGDA